MSAAATESSSDDNKKKLSPMEELLGPTLLKGNKEEATSQLLGKKRLVALYFSASWCPPCKAFSPLLVQFYQNVQKSNPDDLEIVYVSSDRSREDFDGYYSKMPWLAVHPENATIRNDLAEKLQIRGIPSLVVLNVEEGGNVNFVTDQARNPVTQVANDANKSQELVDAWKQAPAVPLEQAKLGGEGGGLTRIIMAVLRNPAFIVFVWYLLKWAMRKMKGEEQMIEKEGSTAGPPSTMLQDESGEESEF